jgi:hypothetical protein
LHRHIAEAAASCVSALPLESGKRRSRRRHRGVVDPVATCPGAARTFPAAARTFQLRRGRSRCGADLQLRRGRSRCSADLPAAAGPLWSGYSDLLCHGSLIQFDSQRPPSGGLQDDRAVSEDTRWRKMALHVPRIGIRGVRELCRRSRSVLAMRSTGCASNRAARSIC